MNDDTFKDTERSGPRGKRAKKRLLVVRGGSYVRDKLHGRTFLIPSCITVVGTFCGFLAIVSALQGHFEYATKCIALAFIIDGLDGRVARRLNATSAFGREFDSLSDVIAFGVAPAVLVYCWGFRTLADELGVLVSFFYVICGAARLARFNIMATDEVKLSFTGLPIPGAAGAVAAIVYAFPAPLESVPAVSAMMTYMLMLGGFMVSTIPFFSFKKVRFPRQKQLHYLVILAMSVALAWKYSLVALVVGTSGYALSGPVQWLWRERAKRRVITGGASIEGRSDGWKGEGSA